MTYILNWSQTGVYPTGKPTISLPALAVDSSSTSITLFGKGAPNYGEGQQESILRILENFASAISPINPTIGQLWFNTVDNKLYVYNSTLAWVVSGGIDNLGIDNPNLAGGGGVGTAAFVEEYNSFVDIYNLIAGTPPATAGITPFGTYQVPFTPEPGSLGAAAAFGYGQPNVPYAAGTLTNQNWIDLLSKFTGIANHQGVNPADISTRGFIYDGNPVINAGMSTLIREFNKTADAVVSLAGSRFAAAGGSVESQIPANGTYSRAAAFNTTKVHDILVSFASVAAAKQFFNTGGKLNFATTLAPAPASAFNTAWQTFLASFAQVGLVAANPIAATPLGTTPKGYYDLTGAYQDISVQTFTPPGVGGSGGWTVQARTEAAGKDVHILVTFNSVPNGAGDTVSGSTTSTMTVTKANNVHINNPVVAYPTVSQTGTFITAGGL